MQFRFDQDANVLYIAVEGGEVARTVEVTDMVHADVDAHGTVRGIEFVSADEFVPFLRRLHAVEDGNVWKETVPAGVRELFLAGAA